MIGEPGAVFGDELRRLRQAAGLSQEALADRAGLTAAAIGALERGERRHPYPHTLQVLADALSLSPVARAAFYQSVPRRRVKSERQSGSGMAKAGRWARVPEPLTSLVGRERDVSVVIQLLQQGSARLVTLTGPGGVGKTRLAIGIASRLLSSVEVGPVWVDLAPIRLPDLVLPTIAHALGLMEAAGQSLTEVVQGHIGHRPTLLVVDNFEHLLAAALVVPTLLEHCPRLVFLVTSREALCVRGEHEVQVLPLGLPDRTAVASADQVARSAAVDLLLQRVHAIRPEYVLTDADAPCISELCARLDGIPLALELAAAQFKYMTPGALLDHLQREGAFLEGRARDLPIRHRSLRATVAWSYDLLTMPEQRLFRRLAVFAGGFSEESACAVCGESGDSPAELSRSLAALVDKSVVQVRPGAGGELRFVMLETIREYARERLIASGEEDLLANRHADSCRHLAEAAECHLTSGTCEVWLRRLDREEANLRADLAWTTTRGNLCAGLALAGALGWFWILRASIGEGTHWTELLLARPLDSCAPEARAGTLYTAAAMAWKRAEHLLAQRYAEESVALRRGLDNRRRLALSLAIAGLVATSLGDLARAIACHEECLALYRDEEDSWGIGYAHANLGDALLQRGDLADAEQHYLESLVYFTRADDPWGRGIVFHTLGTVAWARGDMAAARVRYEASVALLRSIDNRENVARGLIGLAAVALRMNAPAEAQRQLIESLVIWRDIGSQPGMVLCLVGLAAVQTWHGRHQAAARLLGAADTHGRGRPAPYLIDAEMFSTYLAATQVQLGNALCGRAWVEGQALTLEQAVKEALAGCVDGLEGGGDSVS